MILNCTYYYLLLFGFFYVCSFIFFLLREKPIFHFLSFFFIKTVEYTIKLKWNYAFCVHYKIIMHIPLYDWIEKYLISSMCHRWFSFVGLSNIIHFCLSHVLMSLSPYEFGFCIEIIIFCLLVTARILSIAHTYCQFWIIVK